MGILGSDDLPSDVAGLWKGFVADLKEIGGGSDADLILLDNTLRAPSQLWHLSAESDSAPSLMEKGSAHQLQVHPAVREQRNLRRDVASGFDRLGLSLASRDPMLKVEGGRLVRKEKRVLTKEEAHAAMTKSGVLGPSSGHMTASLLVAWLMRVNT